MIRLLLSALLVCFAYPVGAANWSAVVPMYNAAGGAAPSWGVGNLLSERFTGTGTEETWGTATTQGGGTWNPDDDSVTGTGFDGDHLTVSGSSDWEARNVSSFASAQSAVYGRFFFRVNSDSWNDGDAENILAVVPSGQNMTNGTYFIIKVAQVATGQLQLAAEFNGDASPTTGSKTANITAETIYKIEFGLVSNGDNDVWEWKIDGTTIGSRSGAFITATEMRDVWVGLTYTNRAASFSIDTIDISSTGYPDE